MSGVTPRSSSIIRQFECQPVELAAASTRDFSGQRRRLPERQLTQQNAKRPLGLFAARLAGA